MGCAKPARDETGDRRDQFAEVKGGSNAATRHDEATLVAGDVPRYLAFVVGACFWFGTGPSITDRGSRQKAAGMHSI
jgi:hypothetical protein